MMIPGTNHGPNQWLKHAIKTGGPMTERLSDERLAELSDQVSPLTPPALHYVRRARLSDPASVRAGICAALIAWSIGG